MAASRCVLLPFSAFPPSKHSFETALAVAKVLSAEFVLLHVDPATDLERNYIKLRALQAQLHDCSVPFKIETMYSLDTQR